MDCTGQSILPQIPHLSRAGYDVYTLYLPPEDRSTWQALTHTSHSLLSQTLQARGSSKALIVAESFGSCLALRLALRFPAMFEGLVLLNSATSFNVSYGGIPALITATNLLGIFPEAWYKIAQSILLPLLVDDDLVAAEGKRALEQMILMRPPETLDESYERSLSARSAEALASWGYGPAAAAQHRVNLLREGNLPVVDLKQITVPTIALASARDRLFPSMLEGARLHREMMNAKRVILPNSCHAALLERSTNLADILQQVGMVPAAHPVHNKPYGGVLPPASAPPPTWTSTGTRNQSNPRSRTGATSVSNSTNAQQASGIEVVALGNSSNGQQSNTSNTIGSSSASYRFSDSDDSHAQNEVYGAAGNGSNGTNGVTTSSTLAALPELGGAEFMTISSNGAAARSPTLAAVSVGAENGASSSHQTAARPPRNGATAVLDAPDVLGELSVSTLLEPVAAATALQDAAELSVKESNGRSEQSSSTTSTSTDVVSEFQSGTLYLDAAFTAGNTSVRNGVSSADYVSVPGLEELSSPLREGESWSSTAAPLSSASTIVLPASANVPPVSSSVLPASANVLPVSPPPPPIPSVSSPLNLGLVDEVWDDATQFLAPWRDLVSPVVLGVEGLPDPRDVQDRAVLFVGNHQKMGLYDMPLLMYELYVRGYKVKGLAHPGHWSSPMGSLFETFGAVKASPRAAYRLLRSKDKVLLFPGGAKEVNKRRDQEYQLLWQDTPDFVRLAARFKTIIIPFAAVGADDAYDVAMEVDDMLNDSVLGPLLVNTLKRVDPSLKPEESLLPLTRLPGLGIPSLIPVPNLQRLYFKFGTPLDTSKCAGLSAEEMYERVRSEVEAGIEELLMVRASDAESQLSARIESSLKKVLPVATETLFGSKQ